MVKYHIIVLCKTIAVFILFAILLIVLAIYPVQALLVLMFILIYSMVDFYQKGLECNKL